MTARADDRTLTAVAWCWRGGKRHRAYMDSHRMGGEVWWCPRHGLIMSRTFLRGERVWQKRAPRRMFK